MIKELTKEKTSLPVGWETKILGEVCEILDNLRKPITKRDRIEGKYPYYGATGILSYINDYIFDEKLVLIGEDGAKWFSGANSSFIVNGKYWVNNHAHVIRPNRTIILDEWIVYFLNFSDLEEFVTGMTVPKLNQGNLKIIPIPLPPLTQQKQIVATLDKAFAAIDTAKANAEQNLQNAKELFESYLQNVFENKGDDWEKKTFKELSSRIGDGLHGTPKYDVNGAYYFINGNNLNDGVIEIKENTKKINKEEFEKHKKELTNNTVLISINGTLGKVAFYDDEPVILGKSACYINFNDEVNKHYIKYLVKSPLFFKNMASNSTGATIKNFSLKSMRNYSLPLPSIKEQKQIVNKLDNISAECEKLEAIYTQKIADLEEMKNSILQKAFSGQLNTQI